MSTLALRHSLKCKTLSLGILLTLAFSTGWTEEVRYVIDGDTLVMADQSRIRLAGIDAPEMAQPYGMEAKDYLARLVLNKEVALHCNGEMSYQRRICDVYASNRDVQKELVEAGLAFDYTRYSGGKYQAEEETAHQLKRGVWSGGMRPWDYRHRIKPGTAK